MKKKLLPLLLAITCVFSASCGNTADSTGSSDKEITTTTETTTTTELTTPTETTTSQPSQTEVVTTTKTQTPADATENMGKAKKIELSGNKDDVFVVNEACYAVTENAILYFEKGTTVRGDIGTSIELKMKEVSEITGLTYEYKNEPALTESFKNSCSLYFEEGDFKDLNFDNSYVNIVVAELVDAQIPYAYYNFVVLDPDYIYYDGEDDPGAAYHELTHVIFLNNYADMGETLNEGLATYFSEQILMNYGIQTWSWIMYYQPGNIDAAYILEGADGFESEFYLNEYYDQYSYFYGYMFMNFIEETYGKEAFLDIADAVTKSDYERSFDGDTDEEIKENLKKSDEIIKEAIISVTEEGVFEKFADWYKDNNKRLFADWKTYMTSIGEDVSFL